ncbi:nuclease-related domain-containing protein [Streptosporangium sp. NPDC004631]
MPPASRCCPFGAPARSFSSITAVRRFLNPVDHLVIGSAGVFVVDTKHWSRDRRVTQRGRYVRVGRASGEQVARAVRYEAARVSELLTRSAGRPVEVTPVLAIHGSSVPMLRVMHADGVPMLRAAQVRGWIARRPARLSQAGTAALVEAAGRLLPPYTEQDAPADGGDDAAGGSTYPHRMVGQLG